MGMRFCIESKYSSPSDGTYLQVHMVNSTDALLYQLRQDMRQPGWSDSVLVNADALPGPAAESWHRKAAQKIITILTPRAEKRPGSPDR